MCTTYIIITSKMFKDNQLNTLTAWSSDKCLLVSGGCLANISFNLIKQMKYKLKVILNRTQKSYLTCKHGSIYSYYKRCVFADSSRLIHVCMLQAASLSWWPLCRDSACYSVSIIILILVSSLILLMNI